MGGYWPNQQTLDKYKIVSHDEQKRASAVKQIRKNPPSTLLIHGDADPTTGYKQSIAYADAIKQKGGVAKTVILPGVKHGFFFKQNKSESYTISNKEIMEFLIQHFKIKNPDRQAVMDAIVKII